MEEQKENISPAVPPQKDNFWKWVALFAIVVSVFTQIYYIGLNNQKKNNPNQESRTVLNSENEVSLESGVELPIEWQDIGKKMIGAGVIDEQAFQAIYKSRGGLSPEQKRLLSESVSGKIMMTAQNSAYWLNLLWAFGLANKNQILDKGPMQDSQYGGAGNFASTGGWTLAKGNPMSHYSAHELVKLTPDEQFLVEKVSKGIYRPCCGNSTYFPDCNHGMAMLGLLELMAANGVSEQEMYKVALRVNTYWFPDTYLTIDKYLKMKGSNLASADPKEILGEEFSSAYGYQGIVSQIKAPERKSSGGGCGV